MNKSAEWPIQSAAPPLFARESEPADTPNAATAPERPDAIIEVNAPPLAELPATAAPPLARLASSTNPLAESVRMAIERGMQPESLERLLAVFERMEDRAAEKDLAMAIAAFQRDCPQIPRTRQVVIVTKAGMRIAWKYAALEDMDALVRPIAKRYGLMYTWDVVSSEARIRATCRLRHVHRASVEASAEFPIETNSPLPSSLRANAALTMAKRKSLESVLGIVCSDPIDAEDMPGSGAVVAACIDERQVAALEDMIVAVGANRPKFMEHVQQHLRVSRLADIPLDSYGWVIGELQRKQAQATP